jgi:hypothetical protein
MAKGKSKVPKKIAGVKVPKKVRKVADSARTAIDNPLVADLIAAALVAAAAKLRDGPKVRSRGVTAGGEDEGVAAGNKPDKPNKAKKAKKKG